MYNTHVCTFNRNAKFLLRVPFAELNLFKIFSKNTLPNRCKKLLFLKNVVENKLISNG